MGKKIIYGVNERGTRLGEFHHNARLTDDQVELIRRIHEEGFMGYRSLVLMCKERWGLDVSRQTIKSICKYERRCSTPSAYKTGEMRDGRLVTVSLKERLKTTSCAYDNAFSASYDHTPPSKLK
jgi:hypothetical protein